MIVRTRAGVKPVYVSPGHRMDLDTSVRSFSLFAGDTKFLSPSARPISS